MEHERPTTLKRLNTFARNTISRVVEKELTSEDIEKQNERESLLVLNAYAARQFSETCSTAKRAYLSACHISGRGFLQNTIKKFDVGYSLEKEMLFPKSS